MALGFLLETNNLESTCVSCGDKVKYLYHLPCSHSIKFFEKKGCHEKAIKIKLSCLECKEVFNVPVDANCEVILSKSGKEEDTFKFCSSIGCDFMPLLFRSTLQGVSRPRQNS